MITSRGADALNFVRKLTWRRSLNAAKILASYYLSRVRNRSIHWGNPLSISIEPTTACNLRCPECPSGLRSFSRATGNVKMDFYRSCIDQVADDLVYLIFYFQGEPYIHPRFLEMVRYAASKNLYTITSTNGHFLDSEGARKTVESGLDRLIISVDGTTQETYEQYRQGGDLETVLSGVRNLVYWKKTLRSSKPYMIFQFLVLRPNEHQISEVKALAKEIGVDEVKLKTAQVYHYTLGNPLIPENDRYSRYAKQLDGTYKVKHKIINQCWKMWHSCVITWDGQVVPCCFDKDAKYRLGTMSESRFKEIWEGQAYHSFRSKILTGRDKIDICENCTEGCKVWV